MERRAIVGAMAFLLCLLALGLAGPPATPPVRPQAPAQAAAVEPVVRWKGKSYSGAALATALGEPVAKAAQPWAEWTAAQGYVQDLDGAARRLFVHSKRRAGSGESALVDRVLALVDKEAPRPASRTAPPAVPAIFVLDTPADLASLLDAVGRREPYLASWAAGEKDQAGFVLESPLVAACLATSPEQKEWNPRNELANRTAQVALSERFGRLPYWLMQGLAWNAELAVTGSIYCFPFRSGFVAKAEHRSWSEQLKGVISRGPEDLREVTIADLAGWRRGTYENDRALLAWGAASFLVKRRAEALPGLLEDLRALREKEARVTEPDGSWRVNPDYEVPAAVQEQLLKARAGEDCFEELRRFCLGN
jgi:hypothetical protein